MSVTQNWSWIFSMNSSIYNQLRNLIFSKIVPLSSVTNYEDNVITLNFATLKTTLKLPNNQPDVIQINSPISGNIQPTNGVQVPFSGTVSALIDLTKVYIKGDGSDKNSSGKQGITWTNQLYLEKGVISKLTVSTGDKSTEDTLSSFFESEINSYVASSPNALNEMSAANLNPYFVPTYQKFITLTDDSNYSNPRMIQLVMVNNEEPPTADPHAAFDESTLLDFRKGANSVFAFDDYTLYDFIASTMEDSGKDIFDSISVSKNPAVLSAKATKSNYTFKLSSQIANDTLATKLNLTNAIIANIKYGTSFKIVNEDDGSQTLEINNNLTSSSTDFNLENPAVISILAAAATLTLVSPLHGLICNIMIQNIKAKIVETVYNVAMSGVFEKDVPIKQGDGKVAISFMDITLNEGLIISANISVSNSNSDEIKPLKVRMDSTEIKMPLTIDANIRSLSKILDELHSDLLARS